MDAHTQYFVPFIKLTLTTASMKDTCASTTKVMCGQSVNALHVLRAEQGDGHCNSQLDQVI